MRVRVWAVTAAVAMAAGGGAAVADPVLAVGFATVSAAAGVDQAAADRAFVRWLARSDPRANLRAAAWSVLLADDVDAAVAKFLASGYEFSKKRAAQSKARNADFARRVLATHTVTYSPWVHAAAQHALDGGDVELDKFVRSGYAQAKEKDRLNRQADGEHAAAIVQADRDFVAQLRDNDPGPQVRAAAAFALRTGSTDADVVEFFAFDWSNAATLDTQTYRTRCADDDTLWRAAIRRLLADALAAEKAAREAGTEAAAQARAAAARAWAHVGEQTTPARSAWADAEAIAARQAQTWHDVALAAAATSNPNWQVIAGTAQTTQEQWAAERANAAEQAAYWTSLYERALAAEQAMTD